VPPRQRPDPTPPGPPTPEEDVRFCVRPDRLLEDWGTMVLPAYVRVAWGESIRRLRRRP